MSFVNAISKLTSKVAQSANERLIVNMRKIAQKINMLEDEVKSLSDQDLRNRTTIFKQQLNNGKNLDEILVPAFATVREAAKRTISMRHFDVQLIGGIALHRGMIAEMKTGEGKTLVATLAAYLNALAGKGVHLVTVNDYLAKRDAVWMGEIYKYLGLSVGCITHESSDEERKLAYEADIAYGTNNEFAFDYLRDNMQFKLSKMTQRPFHYAIIDEVDSILIDEARTPLIISGPADENTELYSKIDRAIRKLTDESCYEIDEKQRVVILTDNGINKMEEILATHGLIASGMSLYDIQNIHLVHAINQSLLAHKLFQINVDYIIKDGKVMIIDEFTGRMMEGRRYSDGLHQAIEAKENVPIQKENQTLASVTFQNYFRMYPKLAGMTGTAVTESTEFLEIYNLPVLQIPTNLPVKRTDHDDEIYRAEEEKCNAIIELIKTCHDKKQPVLVGTISIENSEKLSKMLRKEKLPCKILNARYHEQEAYIIAQAGSPGAITIATNMAGRGTDIQLGGNADFLALQHPGKPRKEADNSVEQDKKIVIAAGGLFVIGTERHESRRIDNQLRGRSGRQGDPGESKFFLSLEDNLMRIFGSHKISGLLTRLGLKHGEAIKHPMISRALEKAQQKVESRNFDIRKNILKFDNIMNEQRQIIFKQRNEIIDAGEEILESFEAMREELNNRIRITSDEMQDQDSIYNKILQTYSIELPAIKKLGNKEEMLDIINSATEKYFQDKTNNYGKELTCKLQKDIWLYSIDKMWKNHLLTLDHLKQSIGLQSVGQKNPLNEFAKEAFLLFQSMLTEIDEHAIIVFSHVMIDANASSAPTIPIIPKSPGINLKNSSDTPRNKPCPCGSGKKYKYCCGKKETRI
jgi:preprotein translocase subunit SecA